MSDVYQNGKQEILEQNLDAVGSSDVVLILMSDSYSPSSTSHDTISDINADELDADGYTTGFGSADRKTPTTRNFNRNDGNDRVEFEFDDTTWSSLGGGVSDNNDTVGTVVLAEERTDDTDSPLIAYDTLQDDRETNGSDITYSPENGFMFSIG